MDFLKNNKRFSFCLGGKNAWDLSYETNMECNGNEITTTYLFPGGVKVTNVAKKYEAFDAYEWVNYIENVADSPSEIISQLWDCDCTLPITYEENKVKRAYFPDVETATKIYAPTGSRWSKYEFYCEIDQIQSDDRINHIYPNETRTYCASGGRSSEERAPFFNVHKEGMGYIFAIGWTGQWNCQISRANDSITFKSKIEDTYFRLLPGEKIRTSSVVIMPYQCDVIDSHNKWRRLVKKHFSLIGQPGRDQQGPLCAMVWGGMRSESALERVAKIRDNGLPFEYTWMDAGWYGADTQATPDEFEGDWHLHTGDWRISPWIHPNGLQDVSKAVHDAGMKFLLWFEPERVIRTTPIVSEHPEYFLCDDDPSNNNRLLNLGNPDAWEYCYRTLSELIGALHVDCYRQDFNFAPLNYWRRNSDPDRVGLTEIKHINGLYRLWDALLEKFPYLIIDNCASGGRRIDIETMRRSITLWRSDHQCPANFDVEAAQCHNLTFNLWMPYSGAASGRLFDEYRIRSTYAGALATSYSFSERDAYCSTQHEIDFLKKYTQEYLKVRPYLSEDFYPLTQMSVNLDIWCAMQFNRPEKGDGVVEVFKREDAPYETAVFRLRGLKEHADYTFTDADGGSFTVNGKELLENGLQITIKERRKAKVYFYQIT